MSLHAKTLLFLVAFLSAFAAHAQVDLVRQRYCADSLARQAAARGDDSVKVDLLHRQAYHRYWVDTTAANGLNEKAGLLASQLGYRHGIFQTTYTKGNFAEYRKDYAGALSLYNQAEGAAERFGLIAERHDAYASQLNLHFYRGEYVYALNICHKGLTLSEETHDAARKANYTNLEGFIYRNMRQEENAETAFRSYLEQAETIGDSLLLGSAYTEMTQVMLVKKQYDSALVFADQSYRFYDGIYNRHRRAFVLHLKAEAFLSMGLYDSALVYANRAIERSRTAPSNEYDIARYYITAGEVLLKMARIEPALLHLDTALRISRRIKHRENTRDAYELISDAYNAQGKMDSAFAYLRLYEELSDSLINEANLRAIAEMSALYELDKNERDLKEMQQAETDRARTRNMIIGLVVLALIVLFLVYNRYRLKQKNQLQSTINKQQNEMFQAVISAQEKERQRIAGDLHDGLGSLLSSAKLQLNLMKEEGDQKHFDAAYELIDRSSQDLRSISHAIMPAPLKKLGLIAALENVIAGLNTAGTTRFEIQAHGMNERLSEEKELALYNIIMELINNASKHSQAVRVMIQIVRHETYLSLTVEDDGKGFDPTKAETGIGLLNIKKRISYFGGEVSIDSQPGKGATVSIELPVS